MSSISTPNDYISRLVMISSEFPCTDTVCLVKWVAWLKTSSLTFNNLYCWGGSLNWLGGLHFSFSLSTCGFQALNLVGQYDNRTESKAIKVVVREKFQ